MLQQAFFLELLLNYQYLKIMLKRGFDDSNDNKSSFAIKMPNTGKKCQPAIITVLQEIP